ncbi:MAG: universal stress protein [Candidatus Eremiobacteraeota bacterium]|nr:universal stress protein [Candidatus Eremiobacteraeota bacterium]MBV8366399.1 universal stress protein [Candidatus Eremiobacteraeota bacterium]
MFKKLLVLIGGSELSRAATRLAIAQEQGASIAFCHALDTSKRALLDEAVRDARSGAVSAMSDAGEADAVPFILARASEEHVDLIAMGAHGRSGLAHAFLGSTAEGVLRSAPVPVMVVTRHSPLPRFAKTALRQKACPQPQPLI